MHFYTFRPPAPTVRTGTADAERWSGRPRMVCGKGVRVPLGIRSRFRPLVVIASPQPKAPLGAKIDLLGSRRLTNGTATDADRDVSYGEREVADRMNVPLGIGSRSVRLRSGAALADSGCEAAGSGGLGRRVRPLRTHADVEIVGYRSISTSCMRVTCTPMLSCGSARTSTGAGIAYFL